MEVILDGNQPSKNQDNGGCMTLYKFRPLAEEIDYYRARHILETGEFWCSPFTELNDPMEGVFKTSGKDLYDYYNAKYRYLICSFSKKEAFENPIMWGYYAGGFRGMAVEITDYDHNEVGEVSYRNGICDNPRDIKEILLTKGERWKHENEYRFFFEKPDRFVKVGKIKAVYFGSPYGDVVNSKEIYDNNERLRLYHEWRQHLIEVCEGLKYPCYSVKIDGCRVVENKELKSSAAGT